MSNLVYQAWINPGNVHPGLTNSTESASAYATRMNCSYMFSRQSYLVSKFSFTYSFYNILDLIYDEYFDRYDDILYLDTDIIVDPDAGNIFKEKKSKWTDVIGTPERNYEWCAGLTYPKSVVDQHYRRFEEFGSKVVKSAKANAPLRIINTGVIVFTKKGRLKARKTWDDWKTWADYRGEYSKIMTYDQPFINCMFNKYDFNVVELDDEWNFPPHFMEGKVPKSHFYHFSGGDAYLPGYSMYNTPEGSVFKGGKKVN